MSQLRNPQVAAPPARGFPLVTGIVLFAIVVISSNEVMKGGALLSKFKDAASILERNEAKVALLGDRDLKGALSFAVKDDELKQQVPDDSKPVEEAKNEESKEVTNDNEVKQGHSENGEDSTKEEKPQKEETIAEELVKAEETKAEESVKVEEKKEEEPQQVEEKKTEPEKEAEEPMKEEEKNTEPEKSEEENTVMVDEKKEDEPAQVEEKTADEQVKEETATGEEGGGEQKKEEPKPIKLDKNTIAKGSSYEHKNEPLNILLLYGDDWRHDSIGAAGTQIVRTPFIDQLSREGIRFTHNCVTTSVCWISRATLYSGQFMSRHKTTYPQEPNWYAGWNDTFPAKLREAGYYLGQVGKWHFDKWEFAEEKFDVASNYYGDHWYGDVHTTKISEKDGIEFLQNRPKDKPFMLSVCFFAPHSVDHSEMQYEPQPESMSLYENETIVEPISNTMEDWEALPKVFNDINEARRRWRMRFQNASLYQTMMKNYFRLISEVDDSSGKIVKELEKQGLLNNTLIIFTTDNGYFHAEHGMAGKWYPHQESIRVPLVIRDPRMPKEKIGTLNDDFTLNIDLATTILGAAGLPQPGPMQGRDIADLYLSNEEWRDEFFYEHPVHIHSDVIPESSALVRKGYKFMRWPGSSEEQLFDLNADPLELHDLIKSEKHQDIIKEMRARHDELQRHAL